MTTPPFDPNAWPPEPSDDGLSARPAPEHQPRDQSASEFSASEFSASSLLGADDSRPDDDPLARLLRESLQREASTFRIEGDGLQRIRTRVVRRRRWLAIRPVLAVAGAAAVIALIVVVPTIAGGRTGNDLAGGPAATASGNGMHSAAIVWPYQDSKQAADNAASDIDSATQPDLTDPKVTAQSFVDTMFPGTSLRTGVAVQKQSGVTVSVSSAEGEIATIDLRPVKSDDRTVYVVSGVNTKQTGHQLTVAPVGTPSAGVLPLNGTVRNASTSSSGVVNLQLFAPGQGTPAGTGSVSYPGDGSQHNWSYRLPVDDYFEGNGFVLVWTQDTAGVPTAIVAVPTGAPSATEATEDPASTEAPPSSAPGSSAVAPSSPAAPSPTGDATVQSSAPSSSEAVPSTSSAAPTSVSDGGTDPGGGGTPPDGADTGDGGVTPYSGDAYSGDGG